MGLLHADHYRILYHYSELFTLALKILTRFNTDTMAELQKRNIDPIESLEAVMLPKKVHELYGHIRDFNTMLRADRQCFSEEELTSLIAELDDEWRAIGIYGALLPATGSAWFMNPHVGHVEIRMFDSMPVVSLGFAIDDVQPNTEEITALPGRQIVHIFSVPGSTSSIARGESVIGSLKYDFSRFDPDGGERRLRYFHPNELARLEQHLPEAGSLETILPALASYAIEFVPTDEASMQRLQDIQEVINQRTIGNRDFPYLMAFSGDYLQQSEHVNPGRTNEPFVGFFRYKSIHMSVLPGLDDPDKAHHIAVPFIEVTFLPEIGDDIHMKVPVSAVIQTQSPRELLYGLLKPTL